MAVNDDIFKGLYDMGSSAINEKVSHYLSSLGLTGTLSDKLVRYSSDNKVGWGALVSESTTWGLKGKLFGQEQEGGFYLPRPIVLGQNNLFKLSDATDPVTSDGDPVGFMRDLSGNGHHAIQEESASRPIYRTDGALHWLEGDGVNTLMVISGLLPSTPITLSVSAALDGTEQIIIGASHSSNRCHIARVGNETGAGWGSDGWEGFSAGDFSTNRVVTLTGNSSTVSLYVDGVEVISKASNGAPGGSTNFHLFGAGTTTSLRASGKLYGAILVKSVLSVNELGSMHTFLTRLKP